MIKEAKEKRGFSDQYLEIPTNQRKFHSQHSYQFQSRNDLQLENILNKSSSYSCINQIEETCV